MQLTRILSACKKNNVEVKPCRRGWMMVKGDLSLEFYENGLGSGSVTHFTARHPETNASVDLFMDSYFDTIKYAMKYLNSNA